MTCGELYLKDIQTDLQLNVYFRPDYSWAWRLWRSWIIPFQPTPKARASANYQVPVGLGEPPTDCDPTTNRPWREGYHFFIALEITGHCSVMGGRMYAELMPTPAFAPMFPVTQPMIVLPVPNPPSPVPPTPGLLLGASGSDFLLGAGGEIIAPADQ
jgi:hypothetical protein